MGPARVVPVLKLALIFSVMWPSFHLQVLPGLRRHLGKRYYAIATIHGLAGAVAELLGLYIILVAGRTLCRRRGIPAVEAVDAHRAGALVVGVADRNWSLRDLVSGLTRCSQM